MKATTTVGFVGLGNMGLPMCLNLVSSGVSVVALDTNPVAVRQAQEGGAQPAGSIDDIAECSVVITMLPGCSVVDQVMESLLPRLSISEPPTTTILVDCSTVSPSTTHRWFDRAQQDGHILLDAPVSGGVKGAKDATLTFLVGARLHSQEQHRCGRIGRQAPVGIHGSTDHQVWGSWHGVRYEIVQQLGFGRPNDWHLRGHESR